MEIIRHVSTRWLSLELAVDRTLKLYEGLSSMYKSESERTARFTRLEKAFSDPMSRFIFCSSALVYHCLHYSTSFCKEIKVKNNYMHVPYLTRPCLHKRIVQLFVFFSKDLLNISKKLFFTLTLRLSHTTYSYCSSIY